MDKKINTILINKRRVGYGLPVFIIAEAGVNHNGSLKNALKLVDVASRVGADAIKFQTFKAEEVTTAESEMVEYQKKNVGGKKNQLDMLKKLELKDKFYEPIIKHCKKRNIIFLSTPHGGYKSVDFLKALNMPAFKFGSGDLTNLPVLEYVAKLKRPIILGTGMATMKEIKEAIQQIQKTGNNKIIVLHCTTDYPTELRDVNLRAMQSMMKEFGILIGYSDHTLGIQTSIMATTLGACIIEKHFTLDRNMPGPDHKASLEPEELAEMIRGVRDVDVIMGSKIKKPTKNEQKHKASARKSVVTSMSIKRGVKITKNKLAIKRPGTGIEPKLINKVIGKKAKRNLKKDYLIKKSDLI